MNKTTAFIDKKATGVHEPGTWRLPFCFSYLGLDLVEQCITFLAYVDFDQLFWLSYNETCLTSKLQSHGE